jgi:TetR/AcrR family transcriptional regulator, transcriptional repressor for nem operon
MAMSAMVGALCLSRVMTDPKRSDHLLKTVRDHVAGMVGGEVAG